MDDILVTGKDDNANIENLSAVFQRLQQNGLHIKRSALSANSPFNTWDILWIVQGIRVSEERINAIQMMRAPRDQSELRSFLYRHGQLFGHSCPHMSRYTEPLNFELVGKRRVCFSRSEANLCLSQLSQSMICPILLVCHVMLVKTI